MVLRLTTIADDVRFDFHVYPVPTVPNPYTFELQVYNATDGSEYNTATNATLRFTLQNSTLAPQFVPMDQVHGYHFIKDAYFVLSETGVWNVRATITRTSGPPVTATFNIVVGNACP